MKYLSGIRARWIRHVFFLVFLFAGLAGCTFNINLGSRSGPLEETVVSGEGGDKVLLVNIQGLISGQRKKSLIGGARTAGMVERVRETLDRAGKDPAIKAVWVRVNSPGGTVTASDMIYHELRTFKEKEKIKIYVSFLDVAASGGYYIAMAGDEIFAHPTSLTGSIGVIALKPNLEGLLDKVGVDFEVVKSGKMKDFLSPLRSFTVAERKLFQETIDAYHRRFVQLIAENRKGLDLQTVGFLADGRIYNARQALEAHLIDHISYLDETLEKIKKDLGVDEIRVVTYHRPGEYQANLYSSSPGHPNINLVNIDADVVSLMGAPYFMYLWVP